MMRLLSVLSLTTCLLVPVVRADGSGDDELKKKPITTDTSEVGKMLTKWHKEGTASMLAVTGRSNYIRCRTSSAIVPPPRRRNTPAAIREFTIARRKA